jgi:hypothetical protein
LTRALLNETEKPDAEGVEVACNLTFPVRPKLDRVTVEFALFPGRKLEGVGGDATKWKSAETPIVMVEDRTRVPLADETVNE